MRGVWVDEGDALNIAKLRYHGVTRPYFSLRRHYKTDVDHARNHGFEVGGYHASSWSFADNPRLTGRQYADIVNQLVKAHLGGDGKGIGVQYAVNVDIEQHLPDQWMLDFIKRWRAVRSWRETAWSLEPMQAGRLDGIRQAVLDARFDVVPYTFKGDMTPFDHSAVMRDLTQRQWPAARVRLFYDGALPRFEGWDGLVFSQARLP